MSLLGFLLGAKAAEAAVSAAANAVDGAAAVLEGDEVGVRHHLGRAIDSTANAAVFGAVRDAVDHRAPEIPGLCSTESEDYPA